MMLIGDKQSDDEKASTSTESKKRKSSSQSKINEHYENVPKKF